MSFSIYLVYFCIVFDLIAAATLPNYVKICSKSDPEVNTCIKNSAREVVKNIINGNKEFNVPSFNPFYIESIDFSAGNNLRFIFKEINIFGADKIVIDNILVDWENRHVEFNYTFPEMKIDAKYEVDGQILVLPIKGNGPCEITFKNLVNAYMCDYNLVKRKGVEYISVAKSSLSFYPENIKYQFHNLFNGDKRLGDELNRFLNDNWRDIDNEIGATAREAMGAVITSTLANLAKQFPYKDLFKP